MPSDLDPELRRIKLAAFDVDGVFTDGTFVLFNDGRDGLAFNTRDGLGIRMLLDEGVVVALITGRRAEAVMIRGRALGITHILLGVKDKAQALRALAEEEGVERDEILYMGDDLPDLPALEVAGLPAAVADATPEVLHFARLVTECPGGRGAVREVAELLLRAKGVWESAVARCSGNWQ